MAEPALICPDCHTGIRLAGSPAAPLIEATRRLFAQHPVLKEIDIAGRERAMRDRVPQLAERRRGLDVQVASQAESQLKRDGS